MRVRRNEHDFSTFGAHSLERRIDVNNKNTELSLIPVLRGEVQGAMRAYI